jgi:general secretion pathway protein C
MDLAHSLFLWRAQPLESRVRAANRILPGIAVALLVILIAYQLAGLTWTLVTAPQLDVIPVSVRSTSPTVVAAGTGSYTALDGWQPFGTPPAVDQSPVPNEILDAPETTLNLQLWGVNAWDNPQTGQAIISSGRAEQVDYVVGDDIENGSGARLHRIYNDRVLLNRGGRLETLRLPQELVSQALPAVGRPAPVAAPHSAPNLRQAIGDNASRFTEIIRTVPHLEGGQVVGFRLTPGRDRDAFSSLGLEPGDVLTEVNGMILNDPQSAAQVFETLGEASMANVTLLRNGNPTVLTIDMSQIENLTENLQ